MPRCAIVGSRGFPSEELVRRYVRRLPKDVVVISGAASGVDSWAEDEARKRGLQTEIYPADWKKHGRAAGMIRNRVMVDRCDWLIAFYDGSSRGTAHSISLARKGLVPHAIIMPDPRTGEWDIRSTEKPSNLYVQAEKEVGH